MPSIVAIVGRPNVGKSSLFNRLTGGREAIVDDEPGVTRDRLYGTAQGAGKTFYAVDTGGILGEESAFSSGIMSHVEAALEECGAAVMVLDGKAGVTPPDMEIAQLLRKSGKPVVVAVNKLDAPQHDGNASEAYSLGFGRVVAVSALHRRGIDSLLDEIAALLPNEPDEEDDSEDELKLAIVGRPNVGKSSLLNRLAGDDRSLVSPIAGTTRDPVDTAVVLEGQRFRIIDTAGLRRRAKMDGDLEYYSFVRTLAAVDRADVALLLMDATNPCTDQDKRIASHVVQKGKGVVLVLNKWDLVKGEKPGDRAVKKVRDEMPFLSWAPALFTSALSARGVHKIASTVLEVRDNRRRRIPTNALNRLMRDVLAFDRLPSDRKGRALKIYYGSQAEVEPPTFVFFVNEPSIVTTAFENHVKNSIRAMDDFTGSPIRVFWRGKEREEG